MFRLLLVLASVSACATSTPDVRTSASSVSLRDEARQRRSPSASPAPNEHGARLAPPFGGTAGVRRINDTTEAPSDATPDVVAAADRRE
jgi:hypothetical protein